MAKCLNFYVDIRVAMSVEPTTINVETNMPKKSEVINNWPPLTAETLDAMQREQLYHDETYHREISRLSVKGRVTHMTLHFAKYAGYLEEDQGNDKFRRTVTDLFVIGMSVLNGFNVRAYTSLESLGPLNYTSKDELKRTVTIMTGRMAAACERLDHLEDFPYRRILQDAAISITAAALATACHYGWSMPSLVYERLQPIKEKSIFFNKNRDGR